MIDKRDVDILHDWARGATRCVLWHIREAGENSVAHEACAIIIRAQATLAAHCYHQSIGQ